MLFEVGCGDDFEDEVYFKRGRVVTPRFPDINFMDLININFSLNRFYTVYCIYRLVFISYLFFSV